MSRSFLEAKLKIEASKMLLSVLLACTGVVIFHDFLRSRFPFIVFSCIFKHLYFLVENSDPPNINL